MRLLLLPLIVLLFFPAILRAERLENDLKVSLYKRCWKGCQEKYKNASSHDAVLALINDKLDLEKHEQHCRAYNASKDCAYDCLINPSHEYYLRPFLRRNYLNDFICVQFRKYLPCYQHHHSLEHFFVKCGYFALDDKSVLEATPTTCAALRCVTRYIPGLVRQECASGEQALAKGAGDLMERMVEAFLRERVRLHKMQQLCDMNVVA